MSGTSRNRVSSYKYAMKNHLINSELSTSLNPRTFFNWTLHTIIEPFEVFKIVFAHIMFFLELPGGAQRFKNGPKVPPL